MSLHLLTDKQLAILKTLLDRVERGTLNVQGRQPDTRVDREEILTPETYIALAPIGGIPAIAHAVGTGTTSPTNYPRPGHALCTIYQVIEKDGIDTLQPLQIQRMILNVGDVTVEAGQFFTPTRDKFGRWLVPVTGFKVIECDAVIGTSTSTAGGVTGNGCYWQNSCGSLGVPSTLTGTVTSKTGCYADLPNLLSFICVNNGANHYYSIDPSSLNVWQGDNVGTMAANVGSFANWVNYNNVLLADGSKATLSFSGTSLSNQLQVAGYGFTIPTGATITGVKVTVRYSATSNAANMGNGRLDLLGVSGTSQKSTSVTGVASSDLVFGGSGDLWGAGSLSVSDVNASYFGAAFSAVHSSGGSSDIAVDVILITVYYTLSTVCGVPLSGWILGSDSPGTPPNLSTSSGGITVYAEAGYTCNPLSGVFNLNNTMGSSCTITVVE